MRRADDGASRPRGTWERAGRLAPAIRLLIMLLLLAGPGGCGGGADEAADEAAGGADVADAEVLDPVEALAKTDPFGPFALSLAPRLREVLTERAARDDFQRGLDERLAAAVAHSQKRASQPPDKRPPVDLHYDETLTAFYTARGFAPVFTRRGQLSEAAREALALMTQAASHGLDPQDYWIEPLTELAEKAAALSDQLVEAPGLTLFEREALGLAAWLQVAQLDPTDPELETKVIELLLSEGPENPLPRVRGAYDLYRERQGELLELAVELEARMADAYTRYARDMRAANLNRLSDAEKAKYGDEPHPKHHSDIVLARLQAELMAFSLLEPADAARAHVESLSPQHEQYTKLRDAYTRYQAIVEKGGWPTIEPEPMNKGGRAPKVQALKQRLAAEGYYDGPIDDFFDNTLSDAVALYQETHQMEITGETSPVFWRSLNISAAERTAEIRVNLRRWREARTVRSDHYVYINVPDFHAELWRDGERLMRTRIVVGSTRKRCDPSTGRYVHPNATPLQHARLDHLVFNPYWNVPPRIAREEYEPEIAKNPKWLEQNGFEYHQASDGTVLRQLPGPDNALGKVKFIFPNKHNTYMHDTPKQQFFQYPVRAFSHGCMRVEEPMELAEQLLAPEGKWDDKKIWGLLKQRSETRVDLDRPLDVFIEYFTVRVDEFGRTHFLADIYDYVYHEVRPPAAAALRCDPATVADAALPAGASYGP